MKYPFALGPSISFLVWDEFPAGKPLTWHGSMADIFTLYANLYPVMARMVDMSDYAAIVQYADVIAKAMELDFKDANHMPLSRDLSPAKRRAMLAWLRQPVKGTPPSPAGPAPLLPFEETLPLQGGKVTAFARTLLAQRERGEIRIT
jgi:hypothetical protein